MKFCKLFCLLLFPILLTFISKIVYSEEQSCLQCHVDLKTPAKSVHAALGLGCQACHRTVEGKSHPDQKDSIKFIKDMPGLCYDCHDETKFKAKSVHTPVSSGMCTGCHNAHQSNFQKILLKDIPGLCYNCHEEAKFKNGKSGHTLVGMCNGCHTPHASEVDKILLKNQPELCYTCHDKSKFTKKNIHKIINMPGGCTSCHIPHVSDNPSLIYKSHVNDACVTCHTPQATGGHITAAFTRGSKRKYHPVRGVTDPNFPGKPKKIPDPNNPSRMIEVFDPENPGKELTCVSCHEPHSSNFRKLFLIENICQRCHKYY
ncbi:MAG: hypothetical protein HXY53_03640 [Nitrospirae bacterium]|nr:hypothetical protein [Nitrospirota bacterium]